VQERKRFLDTDWKKDGQVTEIVRECLQRTMILQLPDWQVADYLNSINFPVGPWCKSKKWNGRMYRRWIANPLLAGLRERNHRHSTKRYKDGKRRSVKAPPDMLMRRRCEHLAHMSVEEHLGLLQFFKERAKNYQHKGSNGEDPRAGRPKKRTKCPGQMCFCAICNNLFVFGGHGQRDHLMCQGARKYSCWNGASIDGPLAASKLADAVGAEIESLPDFDSSYRALIEEQAKESDSNRQAKLRDLRRDIDQADREIQNLLNFIRSGNDSPSVSSDLQRIEAEKGRMVIELRDREQSGEDALIIPPIDELRGSFRESLRELANDCYEFSELMRRIVPRIVVFPVRLFDGGKVELRARFKLFLSTLLPDRRLQKTLLQPLERVLEVDLFNMPQRAEYRERVIAGRAAGKSQQQVADELGITATAAQYAAALQRMMDQRGISDPFLPVTEPPNDYPKFRRHLHPRYEFDPLPGAGEL